MAAKRLIAAVMRRAPGMHRPSPSYRSPTMHRASTHRWGAGRKFSAIALKTGGVPQIER